MLLGKDLPERCPELRELVQHDRDKDVFELSGRQEMGNVGPENGQEDTAPGQEYPLKPVQITS